MSAPDPKNVRELQYILGSLQYYSRFVNNFARLAALLFTLCKKDIEFKWTEKHHECWVNIKKSMMEGWHLFHYMVAPN